MIIDNGDRSQHHGSAQYFHGIATDADIGNAFPFPRRPDMHFAWATALDALPNHHLLITLCDSVLTHPTGGAARRRPCGRIFTAVKKHSSSSFKPAFAPFGTQKVEKVRTGVPQELRCLNVTLAQPVTTDVRMIAATNRVPEEALADGKLRADLYHRLNVFPVVLPPLRDRGIDIELLAQHFLAVLNQAEKTSKVFSRGAMVRLYANPWPGNVRELKNYVQRGFILADEVIEAQAAPTEQPESTDDGSTLTFRVGTNLAEVERRMTLATLVYCGNVKRKAADVLGISLKTLYNRLESYSGKPVAVDEPEEIAV